MFEQEKTTAERYAAPWAKDSVALSDASKETQTFRAAQTEYDEAMAQMDAIVAEEEAHYQWSTSVGLADETKHKKLVNTYQSLQSRMRDLGYRFQRCQQALPTLQANDR